LMKTRQRRTLAIRFNNEGLEIDDDMISGLYQFYCECYRIFA
jgi:hypothetical protein